MTERFILPPDVVLARIGDSERIRGLLPDAADDDWLLTRPGSRQPSRLVAGEAAGLLRNFTRPSTIVEAVVAFSREHHADPHEVLEQAYPLVQELVNAGLLAPEGAPLAAPIQASRRRGQTVAGFRLGRLLQSLADVEVYQAWTAGGAAVALKLARPDDGGAAAQLAHEAAMLAELDDGSTPRLIGRGVHRGRAYLAVAWCDGASISRAAAELRLAEDRRRLHRLAVAVLRVYARLHRRQVVHGDVHPRNILVDGRHRVRVIDFGLSHRLDAGPPAGGERGGVGLFFEPEYARAWLRREPPPPVTASGEQYSLAVLLYGLFSGSDYLPLALEREAAFRQIAEAPPPSFSSRGGAAWPEVERVLARALAKAPEDRFPSLAHFARALAAVPAPSRRGRVGAGASVAGRWIRATTARLAAERLSDLKEPPPPTASVYYGAAGIAYGLLRLAQVQEDARLLALAQCWSMRAEALGRRPGGFRSPDDGLTIRRIHRASGFHGRSGVHATAALVAQASGRADDMNAACRRFLAEVARPAAPVRELDLALGRAGVLIACVLVRDALRLGPAGCDPGEELAKAINRLGDATAAELWGRSGDAAPGEARAPLRLSGVAHGWAGLFYGLLLWHSVRATPPPSDLRARLDRLARRAEPAGRGVTWPVRLTAGGGPAMASWCNGAPGQAHLWILAGRLYGAPEYLALGERCAWNAWEAEAGNGSLCCGEAGRAYAALALWRETGERAWLARARTLAERAAARLTPDPGRIDGLYKGPLGVTLALADVDRPGGAAFPFFEPLR